MRRVFKHIKTVVTDWTRDIYILKENQRGIIKIAKKTITNNFLQNIYCKLNKRAWTYKEDRYLLGNMQCVNNCLNNIVDIIQQLNSNYKKFDQ